MKNVVLPLLGLSLTLFFASCQKDDFKEASAIAPVEAVDTDTVGWNAASRWEVADQETFSVRYFTIEDANITADVADNGLVLVFKKSGAAINALPFEESRLTTEEEADASVSENSNANYWYHQVTQGSLLISCDEYNAAPTASSRFKYFVITPEKLQRLQNDGYTTEKLMSLSYTEAATVLAGAE